MGPEEVAQRMAASLAYERSSLIAAYNQFRFAFPDRRNNFLESVREQEQRLLTRALRDVPTYELVHPYPVSLHELYDAAVAFCR